MWYAACDADLLLQGGEMLGAQGPFHDGGRDFQVLQAYLGLGPARRAAADADHLVQRRDGDQLPFEDMAAPLGLAQQILGAPADDLDAMPEEFLQHLLERQQSRPAVDQGQQDDADGLLQRRELVELIEHQLRIGIAS